MKLGQRRRSRRTARIVSISSLARSSRHLTSAACTGLPAHQGEVRRGGQRIDDMRVNGAHYASRSVHPSARLGRRNCIDGIVDSPESTSRSSSNPDAGGRNLRRYTPTRVVPATRRSSTT